MRRQSREYSIFRADRAEHSIFRFRAELEEAKQRPESIELEEAKESRA